jgi:hypothetical protein
MRRCGAERANQRLERTGGKAGCFMRVTVAAGRSTAGRYAARGGRNPGVAMLTGRCLCGPVRFQVRGELGTIVHRRCVDCRKAQGAAVANNTPVAAAAFEITSGKDTISKLQSSPGKFRCFCSRCGSPVYSYRQAIPDTIRVRLGTLECDPGSRPGPAQLVRPKGSLV